MANGFNLFRTLDDVKINITSQTPYTFSYKMDGERIELECAATNATYKTFTVKDTVKGLRPDDYSFTVTKSISLINCNKLYTTAGIACPDSIIGYAVIWKSHDSKLRGCQRLGIIKNINDEQTLNLFCQFPKGTFRGCVDMSIVLYLKELGNARYPFVCDSPGAILGELAKSSFYFDGNGSIFPIVTIEDSDNPLLWTVDCSWVDPEEEAFSDCVLIKFNKAHRDYEKTIFGQKKFDKTLFVEVIAAALSIIISQLREKHPTIWSNLLTYGYSSSKGSVCQVIKYMIDTYNLDFSDINTTSVTLRQFLLKNVK